MTEDKLGDSYDIVKRSLLRWLGGKWSVHPMLTAPAAKAERAFFSAYENLIGASIISSTVLTGSNRQSCLSPAYSCIGNLFLDPDSGLTLGKPTPQHLSADELVEIVKQRSRSLTVIFDQSFDRRYPTEQKILEKLNHLSNRGIYAFAYVSHACFITAAGEQSLVDKARERVVAESGLPECRFKSALMNP